QRNEWRVGRRAPAAEHTCACRGGVRGRRSLRSTGFDAIPARGKHSVRVRDAYWYRRRALLDRLELPDDLGGPARDRNPSARYRSWRWRQVCGRHLRRQWDAATRERDRNPLRARWATLHHRWHRSHFALAGWAHPTPGSGPRERE